MPDFPVERTQPERMHAIAVLRERRIADSVRQQLVQAGVPERDITVGAHESDVASLRAEMRDELENSMTSPQMGVAYPKEGLKGILALAPVAVLVCALLAVPVVFVAAPDWDLWLKLVFAAVIGGLMGGTIAIVAGAAAARGPAEPLAAEEGVTVRVSDATPKVLDLLRAHDPIRLDIVLADGTPVGETVTADDDHSVSVLADRLAHQTDTDWSDRHEQADRSPDARDHH